MGIGACGTCREQFRGFPKEQKVGKNAKLPYHFRSGAVNDGVATLLWMDCSPVTMMSTIHPLSSEDSLVLRMRQHARSGFTKNHSAGSGHTIFLAPTAYQAGYQAHPPFPSAERYQEYICHFGWRVE